MDAQRTEEDTNTDSAPDRKKVSAFVVCFNEEDQIAECIESLLFCDEILVVDSFSTDSTPDICKNIPGVRFIQREWPGYKAQKAFGLAEVENDWVVNVDADERVSSVLQQSILNVLEEDYRLESQQEKSTIYDGYEINRVVFHLGRWWRKGGWYPEYRVRFFRKDKTVWGGIDPHEKPIVSGRIGLLEGELHHFTYKNISEQFERLHSFSSIAAKEDFLRGKRASLKYLLANPILRILKFYFLKKGYREGTAGLIVALIEGCYTFMKYAKLWEIQQQESSQIGGAQPINRKTEMESTQGTDV